MRPGFVYLGGAERYRKIKVPALLQRGCCPHYLLARYRYRYYEYSR